MLHSSLENHKHFENVLNEEIIPCYQETQQVKVAAVLLVKKFELKSGCYPDPKLRLVTTSLAK